MNAELMCLNLYVYLFCMFTVFSFSKREPKTFHSYLICNLCCQIIILENCVCLIEMRLTYDLCKLGFCFPWIIFMKMVCLGDDSFGIWENNIISHKTCLPHLYARVKIQVYLLIQSLFCLVYKVLEIAYHHS